MIIYRLTPHAHFRGAPRSSSRIYPDGREELLLSVPKYDFNWQTTYTLEEPMLIPAGTKIVHSTVYDNSTQNPANPDPNRVVPWGEQSFDEMLYGVVQFRELTPSAAHDLGVKSLLGEANSVVDLRCQRRVVQPAPTRLEPATSVAGRFSFARRLHLAHVHEQVGRRILESAQHPAPADDRGNPETGRDAGAIAHQRAAVLARRELQVRLAESHVAAARVCLRGQRVLRLLDALDPLDVAAEPSEAHAQRRFQHCDVGAGRSMMRASQDARSSEGYFS